MTTLEIRQLDPRGPAYPGNLITSGECGAINPISNTIDVQFDPHALPLDPIPVLLYINGKYAGFATLGPDGFSQEEGSHSPWITLQSFLD